MPLIVRNVEPQELKKTPLLQGVQRRENELERMSVASLTTLIRQLSSLAKHAESIMGDVADALAVYYARSQALEERIRRLKVDVLPSLSDEVFSELKILPSDCHFQSDKKIDQQVLNIRRATPALQQQYYAADSVPPLDLLTPLRDDGKRSSQLYSDPSFFFENWRANQLLENTSPRTKLRKHNSSVLGDRESHLRSKVVAKKRSNTMQRQKRQGLGRHQSFGGSELTMQVGRFRSNTSSKAAMIKKPDQHHMLTNLSKVQAEAYISTNPAGGGGGEIRSKPSAPLKETIPMERNYIRRSFSLRKPKANKTLRNGVGGTVRGTRGSCLLEDMQGAWLADQDAAKMYIGLSQQHLEALRLGSPDIPLTPSTSASATVPKRNGTMGDEAVVTFRAPKANRDRPLSLLLHRWEGRQSPKLSHPSRRLQFVNSAGNPVEAGGSSGNFCTSNLSLSSSLSSSCAPREKSSGPADPVPALSKEEMQEREREGLTLEAAASSNERDDTDFFSTSSSTLSKVGVGSFLEPDLSRVLEPYQSGSVSGIQYGQTSDGEGSVVEGDTGGGGATKGAGQEDLVPIQELPRQDSLITVGLDSLSLLTLDDDKVPNGHPVPAWQDSPFFTDCSHLKCSTCADDEVRAKSDESENQDIGRHINPPHKLTESGKQTQVLSPLASQSQRVEEIGTVSSHNQPSEKLDLASHNQSIETLDHKSCNQPFEMLDLLHSQHSGTKPIVTHIQDQPSNTTLFANSKTPISTPLSLCQPPNPTPCAHSHPSNSVPLVQAELMEVDTTILCSESATMHSGPSNVTLERHSILSPPVEATHTIHTMDLPAIPGVEEVHTKRHLQHWAEPKTHPLFVARDARTAETPLVRKNLLEAIRAGIQLRKVSHEEKSRFTADTSLLPWDVAAILERRMALSESDDDSDTADNEWEGEW